MTHAPLNPQTLYLMRETIHRRLEEGTAVREAAAEARGIASGREPGCNPRQVDAVVHDLLAEIDALLPDLAPVEHDGRTYRPVDDQEVASALAYALAFDERGKRRKTGWEGMFTKIAAASLAQMLRRSNLIVFQGPPSRHHSGDYHVPGKSRATRTRRGAE